MTACITVSAARFSTIPNTTKRDRRPATYSKDTTNTVNRVVDRHFLVVVGLVAATFGGLGGAYRTDVVGRFNGCSCTLRNLALISARQRAALLATGP